MATTPTATPADDSEARINALLSQDQPGGEGTERAPEDTSVADADLGAQEKGTAAREAAAAVATEEEAPPSEEAAGETPEFELTEQDRDFSTEAYARAAEHYSKQAGKQLDPNDPGDRFILRELMQRGQKIRELQEAAAVEEEAEAGEEETKPAEEAAAAEPAKLTSEQLRQRVTDARAYAKSQIVPEVAMEFARGLVDAMWPGKGVGEKIGQEQANALAEVFSTFAVLQIADAIPSILNAAPQAVLHGDPLMARMRDMAMRESAVDELLDATDKEGKALYPNFEALVDNRAIKQAMNSDELKSAVFHRDPYKNLVAKLKVAYKIVQGKPVDVGALEKAAQRGREIEQSRARAVGAGRLPPGNSKGGFAQPSAARNFIQTLVGESGSKFHKAIEDSRKK